MRKHSHGRGAHYASNTLVRQWRFDEPSLVTTVYDALGTGQSMGAVGTNPAIIPGLVGDARQLAGGSYGGLRGGSTGSDATELAGSTWSVGLVCRLRDIPASGIVYLGGYIANNGGTSATNNLIQVGVDSDGMLVLKWQSGSNTDRVETTDQRWPLGEWTTLVVDRSLTTQVSAGFNGRLEQYALAVANSGGTSCRWRWGLTEADAAISLGFDICSWWLANAAIGEEEAENFFLRSVGLAFANHVDFRVSLEHDTGVMRNLMDIEGLDFVAAVSGGESVDDAVEQVTLELFREVGGISLVPDDTQSIANLSDITGGITVVPFVEQGKRLTCEAARVPLGIDAQDADWVLVFDGSVDDVDWESSPLKLQARNGAAYAVDDVLEDDIKVPADGSLDTGGCGTEAAPLETAIQDLFDEMHEDALTVYAPWPANLCLFQKEMERGPFWEKARELATVRGWDMKMRFAQHPDENEFKPTLTDPRRDRVDVDGVISSGEILRFKSLGYSRIDVRNRIRGIALSDPAVDAEGYDQDGNGVTITRTVEDSTSKSTYKTRFMELRLDSTSFIRGEANLLQMLNSVLADLKDPLYTAGVELTDLFELELNDYLTYRESYPWTYGTLRLATTSKDWSYTPDEGYLVNTNLRQNPSGGFARHLQLDARPVMGQPIRPPSVTLANPLFGRIRQELNVIGRSILANGRLLQSARGISVPNGDFSTWSGGPTVPPDGWALFSGTWGTALTWQMDDTIFRTGNRSIKVNDDNVVLASVDIPVSDAVPYFFELDWRVASGDDFPRLDVLWLDEAGVTIGTQPLLPGVGFASVTPVVGVWYTSKYEGLRPVAGSASMRLHLQAAQVGGSFGTINIDRVQAGRCAAEVRMFLDTTPTWSGVIKGDPAKNIEFSNVSSLLGGFDRGAIRGSDKSTSVGTYSGDYIEVQEDGSYDVATLVNVVTDGTGGTVGRGWLVEIVKNAEYDGFGFRTAGTVIQSKGESGTFKVTPTNDMLSTSVFEPGIPLVKGDRISIDLYVVEGDGSPMTARNGASGQLSYFHVRQKLAH